MRQKNCETRQPSRKDTLGTVLPVATEISLKTVKMTYFDSLLKFFFVGLVCLSSVGGKQTFYQLPCITKYFEHVQV